MPYKALDELVWTKDAERSLRATFSRFNVVDHDGDVTLPSAFTDGQPVPMVWSHDWQRPVGKGVIRVLADRAVFDGRFFPTAAGQEAYQTVKEMGDLQQYSYGYAVREASPGTVDGNPVRLLKGLEVFEVSPVLVGAGVETRTDRIKAAGAAGAAAGAEPSIPFAEHAERVVAAVLDLRDRVRAVDAMRTKEGRRLSAAHRTKVAELVDALAGVRGELEEFLPRADPGAGASDLEALFARFRRAHLPGGS